ncbi:MAG: glycogen debranching protein GlgX [Candidatus Obscuribacterales bacterium]|nr:glycogen debranching protein GlgX [Candidatus Obscuribacterales bacterium]
MAVKLSPGKSYPVGATVYPDGVNFSIFSKYATAIDLLLFDDPHAPSPSEVIQLDPFANRTFYYWHIFIPGLRSGQVYAYRAYGPYAPEQGQRFDPSKVLLDPYAKAVVGWDTYDREAARQPCDNCAQALRAVIVDPKLYDWEGDAPLRRSYAETVIYEMHIGGFTKHPNSGVDSEKRGTYAGLIEKIPYLKSLGVTAVELMPIHQFDEQDAPPGLKNYWGYSTMTFFAPHRPYSFRKDPLGPVDEFRDLVKALHKAGIEVILDVVFNHTAEGNDEGPTFSFRGLDNKTYYLLERNQALYSNYTGCGNALRANHPIVGRMILDSLRYWVQEMHVDGFRFDLASVLSRSIYGNPLDQPGILWAIESDPLLAGTKLIAEAWDPGGLYQVGSFINHGDWFAEWNGPFRDDVRRFVKGEQGTIQAVANRILGSSDIYLKADREPSRSIQFVTCHDGFTLNDLVSYNSKHNLANGENNRDGSDANFSWNCGVEGTSNDDSIQSLRRQQIKNMLTILFISQGAPMLLMGDEIRRTQKGNNNAYCQDNDISWFDWDQVEKNKEILQFTQELIRFTKALQIFSEHKLLVEYYDKQNPHIIWHGVKVGKPDWNDNSHSLAFSLCHPDHGEHLYVILNAFWEALKFELPVPEPKTSWHRIIDTSLGAQSIIPVEQSSAVNGNFYTAAGRSAIILITRPQI